MVRVHDDGAKVAAGAPENSHSDPQVRGRETEMGMMGGFEALMPALVSYLLQDHTSQSVPNSSTDRGSSIQIHEPMRIILVQNITGCVPFVCLFFWGQCCCKHGCTNLPALYFLFFEPRFHCMPAVLRLRG